MQAFSARGGVEARFDLENERYLRLGEGMQWVIVWGLPVVSVVGSGCVVLGLWLGAPMVSAGQLSAGQLTSFIVYINLLVSSLTSLGWFTSAIQRGYLSLGRIFELFDHPPGRPVDPQDGLPLPPPEEAGRALRLADLSFRYPEAERAALSGLNFELKAGETLGVFGLTGSGKSTLLDLLARVREPEGGKVFLDEVDITEVGTSRYWEEVSYAQQSPFLFSDTLFSNLTMSAEGISDKNLEVSLEDSALQDEIAGFSAGLQTKVGERGVTLSGGQRQRVSLARAFYRGTRSLLLLDDVMSAVDHRTEQRLIEGILERAHGSTTVIVSHRMSVLQQTDRILVLDNGQQVTVDTHAALVAQGGIYAEAWLAQQDEPRSTTSGREGGDS
ncbi:MAG: ABC transporter ATP-binding protein [Myxococcota bacterium]|nr:ABC transporter ATP-binding protein [Myxococcota bacterium]